MVTERAAARMAVKNFFVFFMVNTPLKLCYMKDFVWGENDCRLRSCRRHRLRSRNVFFIAVLPLWFDFPKSSEKIKKSVPNNRDRQNCDTTRVDVHYPNIRSFLIHHHVCTLVNAVCSASAIPEMQSFLSCRPQKPIHHNLVYRISTNSGSLCP